MKNIILIGMKGCGKTTVGYILSQKLGWDFIEVDKITESIHKRNKGEKLSCSNIFKFYGEKYFREIESEACHEIARLNPDKSAVISCGGGTVLAINNQKILKRRGIIVFLDTDHKIILKRIMKCKLPSLIKNKRNPQMEIMALIDQRQPIYNRLADQTIKIINESPEEVVDNIIKSVNL